MARKLNRSKKNSILNFVAVAIVTIIALILTFGSFPIPFSTTGQVFNGFASSVSVGLELEGGVSAVYDCELPDGSKLSLDEAIENTTTRLTTLLNRQYSETTVTRLGDNQIRVEVSGAADSDSLFSNIGTGETLYLTYEANGTVYVDGSVDIVDMYASYQSYWGVVIEFSEQGQEHFAELTQLAADSDDQKIYFYLGDVSGDYLTYMECSSQIDSESTFIGNSDWDESNATNYIYQLVGGTFPSAITLNEISTISATLGDNTLTFITIAFAIALVLLMIFMLVRYGDLGALADFAIVIYTVLLIFFMQAISIVQLTLLGVVGIFIGYFILVDGMIITFERIRREYISGQKLPIAVKNGFNKTFLTILDVTVIGILMAVALCVTGITNILSFAIIIIIGLALSLFVNCLLMRGFAKWYINLGKIKPKNLRLPKQERPEKTEIVVEGGEVNA